MFLCFIVQLVVVVITKRFSLSLGTVVGMLQQERTQDVHRIVKERGVTNCSLVETYGDAHSFDVSIGKRTELQEGVITPLQHAWYTRCVARTAWCS